MAIRQLSLQEFYGITSQPRPGLFRHICHHLLVQRLLWAIHTPVTSWRKSAMHKRRLSSFFIFFLNFFAILRTFFMFPSFFLVCAGSLLWNSGFSCFGARALEQGFSSCITQALLPSMACGIFPDQRVNPCPLHWTTREVPQNLTNASERTKLN